MAKLKPCPFCGYRAVEMSLRYPEGWKYVACLDCGSRTASYPPNGSHIKAWNRRVNNEPTD